MRRVFADSLYWIALSHQGDQWHAAALKASHALQRAEIVTTQEMLAEFLTAFRHTPPSKRTPANGLPKAYHLSQGLLDCCVGKCGRLPPGNLTNWPRNPLAKRS